MMTTRLMMRAESVGTNIAVRADEPCEESVVRHIAQRRQDATEAIRASGRHICRRRTGEAGSGRTGDAEISSDGDVRERVQCFRR